MRRKGQLSFDESLINLTPLIDVVFVVLVAFILIAPLIEVERIDLAEGGSKKETLCKSNVAIYVKEDDSIYLNQKKVSLKELGFLLKEKRKAADSVKLFHDKKATFGTYQAIKNVTEEAGFQSIDVVLKTK